MTSRRFTIALPDAVEAEVLRRGLAAETGDADAAARAGALIAGREIETVDAERGDGGAAAGRAGARVEIETIDAGTWDAALAALRDGRVDAALVSPLGLLTDPAGFVLLPGIALSSRGSCPAARLHLFSRLEAVRTCGDAAAGHAAAFVAKLTLASAGRPDIELVPFDGGADDALGEHEAVVTAGDLALAEETPEEATAIDLGEAWSIGCDAPFVWGVLAARRDGPLGDPGPGSASAAGLRAQLDRLAAAAREGLAAAPEIATALADREGCSRDHVLAFLAQVVVWGVGDETRAGVDRLVESYRATGLAPDGPPLAWLRVG